ncbi:major facilitator superfamily mfs_1 [Stylonychia lemnae]|uniref:Major facilitator superfamily mfs_1 n=1 Tax=Stylonychia lemnae TaxID=5949 RepID=A0A078ATR5_STYLE|nr:major facilitator superfamily mfs_1 [Stylonychia lemnae]|eukprot:CDW84617.1 major facilitator superfamily mfs_1 [Stylonychia lemnae]
MYTIDNKTQNNQNTSLQTLICPLELEQQPIINRLNTNEDLHQSTQKNSGEVVNIICKTNSFLGIKFKERVQLLTGISIYIVTIMGNLVAPFIFHSSNIILKNKFNLNDEEELVKFSSMIYMTTIITLAIVSPFIGGLLDFLGRRKMLTIIFISTGVFCAILPLSARIWLDFTIIRIILAVLTNTMINNTLIADYVKNESIGKAVIYNNFSRYIGAFLSTSLFLSLIAYTSISITYNVMAVLMCLTGAYLFFSLKEPQELSIIEQNPNTQGFQNNQRYAVSYWSNIKGGIQECKNNSILIFCLMQNFVVRMGTVLGSNAYSLWVLANIADQKQAFALLAFALSLSSFLNFLIQIPLIKLLDKIRPSILLFFVQIFRGCSLLIPMLIDNKNPQLIAAAIVIMALANGMANVGRDLIFQKNQGAQSRGAMVGFMDLFQNIGILLYISVFAFLFQVIGLNGCFAFLGICDLILLAISMKFDLNKRSRI